MAADGRRVITSIDGKPPEPEQMGDVMHSQLGRARRV